MDPRNSNRAVCLCQPAHEKVYTYISGGPDGIAATPARMPDTAAQSVDPSKKDCTVWIKDRTFRFVDSPVKPADISNLL